MKTSAGFAPSAGVAGDGEAGSVEHDENRGDEVEGRYRLRDLDRRGRLMAAALAAALLLAPVLAFVRAVPDWTPANDPALMALRTLDVGTSRTPVSGQPSQSAQYVDDLPTVTHLGPIHFYVMAVPVRVLGAAAGMLAVSVVITGGALLLMAWAVLRQLGPTAAVLAALILSAITMANGAASLLNPVSSNIAGYPMFCSMVLLWCLLCGDVRLLPLTTGVLSFTVQQHLSVGPAVAVAVVLVGGVLLWRTRKAWPELRRLREVRRGVGWSAAVAAVLWAPVVLQQLVGDRGNLTTLWEYTTHDDRPTLGLESALRQVAHVVGLPSALSQSDLTGFWLMASPSAITGVSAVVVLGLVLAGGIRLWSSDRRRRGLVVMVGVLVMAGLVNGSSVPEGLEAPRPAFYHWVWPLTFFVILTLALAAVPLLRSVTGMWGTRPTFRSQNRVGVVAVAAVVVVMVTMTVTGLQADRFSNSLGAANSPVERRYVEELADGVMALRDAVGDQTVVVERGQRSFEWIDVALTLELVERGVDARLSRWFGREQFVHADRMPDRDSLDSGLVLVVSDPRRADPDDEVEVPGELVVSTTTPTVDAEALDQLVAQAEATDEVILGDDMEAALAELDAFGEVMRRALLDLPDDAATLLHDAWAVELLREVGIEQPRLDADLLDQIASSRGPTGYRPYTLDLYLLDRDEMLAYGTPAELGPED